VRAGDAAVVGESTNVAALAPFAQHLHRKGADERATTRRPLAICIGWFGAEVKYVRKYAEMYVSEGGCDAVVIAPPSAATLVPTAADAYASVVARALENVVQDRDVVLHVASNGGFIFCGTLMIAHQKLFSRVKGVVFDCAPGDLRPDIIARALTAVVKGTSATNAPAPAIFETFATWLLNTAYIKDRLRAVDEAWGKIEGGTRADALSPALCKAMFVYSEADVLISPREIEAFARTRRLKTGEENVVLKKFNSAAHCEIGRDHYAEYKSHVREFVASLFKT